MKILVYEFITGGGWYSVDDNAPPPSLAREGEAMLRAVAADLAALAGVQVAALRDRRRADLLLPGCQIVDVGSAREEAELLSAAAATADETVVIAPEFDSLLLNRCRQVLQAGGKLLGPGLELVALASDKQATAEHLAAAGVPVPHGIAVAAHQPLPDDFAYPAVWKPRDGAGSQGVRKVDRRPSFSPRPFVPPQPGRLERFCPGVAA
ncbi:MAG: ATP-grasp domain-containing protein, partial [Pirellulales bacterium]